MAKNFYAYVNQYRVEEAKRKITDARLAHLNLTGIALESGFKSKSAFNLNFKKITGYTPTEWRSRSAQLTDQITEQIPSKAFNPGGLNAFTSDKP
jgi:AraC-like DNA-binding protein